MHCDGCAARVKMLLEREPRGVKRRFTEGQARVRYDQHAVSVARRVELIRSGGEASSSA
jgi:copper chaperone CopZ